MSHVSGKPCFVYVLWSPSGHRFYTGISEDPEHRAGQHNQGISKWTTRYRPWELVHVERFNSYTDARKRELLLKMQKSGQGFFQLTGIDPARFARCPKGS
jgi:putative endonuclease